MKKILHLQIPLYENTLRQNNLAISPDLMSQFLKLIKDALGEEYVIIASPCIPSMLTEEDTVYNFDMKQLSLDNLKKMVNQ